jgi:hypothetical protein
VVILFEFILILNKNKKIAKIATVDNYLVALKK